MIFFRAIRGKSCEVPMKELNALLAITPFLLIAVYMGSILKPGLKMALKKLNI